MPRTQKTMKDRFAEKVVVNRFSGCWMWTAATSTRGYGLFNVDGRMREAHIVAWELWVGPVPAGKVLDHYRCDTKRCVNPQHLHPTTRRANSQRNRWARRTKCSNGHEYTPKNTHFDKLGRRRCRRCDRDRKARKRARAHAGSA